MQIHQNQNAARNQNAGKKQKGHQADTTSAKGTNIKAPDAKEIAAVIAADDKQKTTIANIAKTAGVSEAAVVDTVARLTEEAIQGNSEIQARIDAGKDLLVETQTIGAGETGKVEDVVAPKTVVVPALVVKRASRIAGLQELVVTTLKTSAATVTEMAVKFEVPERDVRLAIDRARAKGENIKRLSKNTFGYSPIPAKA